VVEPGISWIAIEQAQPEPRVEVVICYYRDRGPYCALAWLDEIDCWWRPGPQSPASLDAEAQVVGWRPLRDEGGTKALVVYGLASGWGATADAAPGAFTCREYARHAQVHPGDWRLIVGFELA